MQWEDTSSRSVSPEEPLLYPGVNYPREPTYTRYSDQTNKTNTGNSVRIEMDSLTNTINPYRRTCEIDLANWDDDAAIRLRNTARPTAGTCDFLSPCRPYFKRWLPSKWPLRSMDQVKRPNREPFGVGWFVGDACGIVCLVITWMLILYAEFVVFTIILLRAPSTLFCYVTGVIYHFFTFMAVVSHIKAFATDPGTVPIGNATKSALIYITDMCGDDRSSIIRCPKCLCVKPPRAHHCRICYRCVRKMDHHCPWINNCVGEGNQKYFVLFTFYICLQSFFAIYMSVHFIMECVNSDWELCHLDFDNLGLLTRLVAFDISPIASCGFILGLVMEALVFGLFTLVMCSTQVSSMAYDETNIESLSKNNATEGLSRRSRCKNLTLACGFPFGWRWFNPFTSPPPVTPVFPPRRAYHHGGTDFAPNLIMDSVLSSSTTTVVLGDSVANETTDWSTVSVDGANSTDGQRGPIMVL